MFSAVHKPAQLPACLHTKAVFTATQINPEKSVFSGVPATADGAINVVLMPTPLCPSLHKSTAPHTGPALIRSTQVDRALNIVKVPTSQCPQTLCLADHRLPVKTGSVRARSAQADSVAKAVNVPGPRPRSLAGCMSPMRPSQTSLTQLSTVAG